VITPQRPFAHTPPAALLGFAALGVVGLGLSVVTARQPITAVVLFAVGAIVIVCTLRVDLAALLLIALGPLEGAFQISANAQITPTKVVGLLCFASFFLTALATRQRLRLDVSHAILLALLGLAFLSAVNATDTTTALSVVFRYASFVALYIVLSQFVRDRSLQERTAWALSIASAVAGVIALQTFFGGESTRATLPYADPNDVAFVLATTLPLTFWLLGRHTVLRPALFAMIGLISAAILFSFSRGALVGLAAGALWTALTRRRHIPVLVVGAAVGALAALVLARTDPATVEQGLELKRNVASANVESRFETWRGAAHLALQNPIGVGPGNFETRYFEATGRPPSTTETLVVHNAYLDVAAEVGVVALALFLAYLVIVFTRLTQAMREALGPPGLAEALRTSLVIALVGAIFLSEQYYAPFWVIGGLATALWAERERRAEVRGEQ
jgi:putative inorganic carbon (hco3(-)) transporter